MSISTFTTRYSLAVRVFVSLRLVTVLTCSYHRLLVLMHDKNVYSLVLINSCKLRSFKCFSSHSFPSLVPRSFSIHFPLLHLILSSYSLLSISILLLQSFISHSFPTSSIRTKSNPYILPAVWTRSHFPSSTPRHGGAEGGAIR